MNINGISCFSVFSFFFLVGGGIAHCPRSVSVSVVCIEVVCALSVFYVVRGWVKSLMSNVYYFEILLITFRERLC